jgi:uncharacterized protein (TIGR02186 family)
MRLWASIAAALLAFAAAPGRAEDVPLVADLSSHLVAITTGFTGTNVLLFGATDGPGDIAVVVRGPAKDIDVRRKERIGPIWINATSVGLHDVPSYYRVASTRPLAEFAPDDLQSRYQIGLNNLRLPLADDKRPADDAAVFRRALVKLKTEAGLYSEELGSVNMMSSRLFRTELHFPSNVPTGTYLVEVYLFRDGAVTSAEIVPFTVSKIGVGADIYDFAQHYGAIYGILSILLAVASGYAAGAVFRRT